jgi:glycosyltransferase involved in cell wall biosynthesis
MNPSTSGLRISVILPTRNSGDTLEACVESVLASDHPPLEVLVVDDASVDETPGIVTSLTQEHPDQVFGFRLPYPRGPAAARNHGARHARGEALFFLDSDTVLLPGSLGVFAEALGGCDAVTGTYDAEALNPGWVPAYKALFDHYYFTCRGKVPLQVFSAAVAGLWAEVFREVGGFDESLRWGMDYECEEFGERLTRSHLNLLVPGVVARHRFPRLGRLTCLYFRRAAQWAEFFLWRTGFDTGAHKTLETALATLSPALALLALPLALLCPAFRGLPFFFLATWLLGYLGFFRFVARRRPGLLGAALGLNFYLALVLSLGAGVGLGRALFKRIRTA